MKLFISPHNDDESLFGAFTIMRERPTVLVMFDSIVQRDRGGIGCDWMSRREETRAALRELTQDRAAGAPVVPEVFAALGDHVNHSVEHIATAMRHFGFEPEAVWAPAWEDGGHAHHNAVARAADAVYPGLVTHYATYTAAGKSRGSIEVQPRSGEDIARKLRALACYTSQLQIDPRLGCWPHFMRDLSEYYV